jgi:hypothetical protein
MENDQSDPISRVFRHAAEGPSFVYLRYPSPTENAECKLKHDLRLNNLERRVIELELKILDSGR